jgi:predicted ATPase
MTLPRDETPFFGREAEIGEIERRFAAGARLVTTVGIGGVGKTRLAIEAAERIAAPPSGAPAGEDRVAFAALAGSRTLEAAVRAVAKAVRAKVPSESKAAQGVAAVGDAIAKRGDFLLVLDNVEQLGAAAEELVSAILDRARSARILATSREPTGARGEEKIVLAPLAEADAQALFLERARAAVGGTVNVSDDEVRTCAGATRRRSSTRGPQLPPRSDRRPRCGSHETHSRSRFASR